MVRSHIFPIAALGALMIPPPLVALLPVRPLAALATSHTKRYCLPSSPTAPTPQESLAAIQSLITEKGGFLYAFNGRGEARDRLNDFLGIELSQVKPRFFQSFIYAENTYVPREDLEKKLQKVRDCDETDGEFFFRVAGPEGAGKSAIIAHMFGGRPGAIAVEITEDSSMESIVASILGKCGISTDEMQLQVSHLMDPLLKAWKTRGAPVKIIMEMNVREAHRSLLGAVRYTAKKLAHFATVVIVTSGSNGGADFGAFYQEPRLKTVWVDAMTNAEALSYARKINVPLSEAELTRFFDTVGTLPAQINELLFRSVEMGMSLDEIIHAEVIDATVGFNYFPFKKILASLKESPDGVKVRKFSGVKENGILLSDPELVAPFLKENVVLFHFPSHEYRLMTNAHKTAMRDYEMQ